MLVVALFAPAAHAYPQWQLSTGESRCSQCHFAPAGGGLLTNHGRDAVGDLSTFGGDGAVLHGAVELPAWLALGADLRGAFVDNDVQDPAGNAVAVFPMQADLTVRVALPFGIALVGTGGFRGQTRDPDTLVPLQNYQPISTSRLISREHYLILQPAPDKPYLRVGRFFAPFGLRLAEHILYSRRDLGFDQLHETYNVSASVVFPAWEAHLTLFGPDFVRGIGSDETGVAVLYERRLLDDRLVAAGQARTATAPGVTRLILGGYLKGWIPRTKTLLFTEINAVQLRVADRQASRREQLIATAGATYLPVRGVNLTLLGEREQLDLALPDSWTAVTALIGWFPYAHTEIQLMGRLQVPSGGSVAQTLFIQIHYFL